MISSTDTAFVLDNDLTIQNTLDVAGTLSIFNGSLTGGTVNGNLEVTQSSLANELNGITLNGDLDILSASNRKLTITNGLTHEGTIRLGSGAEVTFLNNNTLTGVGSGSTIIADGAKLNVFGTFVIDSNVTVQGPFSLAGNTQSNFTNQGTIIADSGTTNIAQTSDVFGPTYFKTITNTGTMRVESGAVLNLGQRVTAGSSWTSANGILDLNGGTMNLGGQFETADLNQANFVRNGGTLNLTGELDNTSTLYTTTSGGALGQVGELNLVGGTIVGGSVMGDLVVGDDSRFEGSIAVVGDIDMTSLPSSYLTVTDGLTHEGVISLGGNATLDFFRNSSSDVIGSGSGSVIQSVAGAEIRHEQGRLTFDAGTTLRGEFKITPGTSSQLFVNSGTIIAETGTSFVESSDLVNFGTTTVKAGASLETKSIENWSDIVVETGGVLTATSFHNVDYFGTYLGAVQGGGHVKLLGLFELTNFSDIAQTMGFQTSLEFGDDAVALFDFFGETNFNQLDVAQDVTLDGDLILSFNQNFQDTLRAGQTFDIIDVLGSSNGQFDNYAEGDIVGNFNGLDLFLTYSTSTGSGVSLFTIAAVPEPGGIPFLSLAMLTIAVRRRKVA